MKELSIKEKANRYDEVIKKANKMHHENCEACQMCIEELFFELAESDNERIRKVLIQYFKNFTLNTFAGLDPKKILAWLEKQGQKPQGKSALDAAKEEKVDNQNCIKPANKVEPKFHEGDWVTIKE